MKTFCVSKNLLNKFLLIHFFDKTFFRNGPLENITTLSFLFDRLQGKLTIPVCTALWHGCGFTLIPLFCIIGLHATDLFFCDLGAGGLTITSLRTCCPLAFVTVANVDGDDIVDAAG